MMRGLSKLGAVLPLGPRWIALLAIPLALGAAITTVDADHAQDRIYFGQHSGGGAVALQVSGDGSTVVDFLIQFDSPDCPSIVTIGSVPISNHAFGTPVQSSGAPTATAVSVSGSFSGTSVSGDFSVTYSDSTCNESVTWSAQATSGGAPPVGDISIVPTGSFLAGVNSIVVQGAGSSADVSAVIAADSGREVQSLWLLLNGQWRFFLPSVPAIDGGLQSFAGPLASAIVVLGAPGGGGTTPPPSGDIQVGPFTITDVSWTLRFPAGCTADDPVCLTVDPASFLLVVTLTDSGPLSVPAFVEACGTGAISISSGGQVHSCLAAGSIGSEGGVVAIFNPPLGQTGFSITLPGAGSAALPNQ